MGGFNEWGVSKNVAVTHLLVFVCCLEALGGNWDRSFPVTDSLIPLVQFILEST